MFLLDYQRNDYQKYDNLSRRDFILSRQILRKARQILKLSRQKMKKARQICGFDALSYRIVWLLVSADIYNWVTLYFSLVTSAEDVADDVGTYDGDACTRRGIVLCLCYVVDCR